MLQVKYVGGLANNGKTGLQANGFKIAGAVDCR